MAHRQKSPNKPVIAVYGEEEIHFVAVPPGADNSGVRVLPNKGGRFLIAPVIQAACPEATVTPPAKCYQRALASFGNTMTGPGLPSNQKLFDHYLAMLRWYQPYQSGDPVLRIEATHTFQCPSPTPQEFDDPRPACRLIVVQNRGQYAEHGKLVQVFNAAKRPHIRALLYLYDGKDPTGHEIPDTELAAKTVLLVSGDALRRLGVELSDGLSSERTLRDFAAAWRDGNSVLASLSGHHLVTTLGDSALVYRPPAAEGDTDSRFWFMYRPDPPDPVLFGKQGRTVGQRAILIATLARQLLAAAAGGLEEPISLGLAEGLNHYAKHRDQGLGLLSDEGEKKKAGEGEKKKAGGYDEDWYGNLFHDTESAKQPKGDNKFWRVATSPNRARHRGTKPEPASSYETMVLALDRDKVKPTWSLLGHFAENVVKAKRDFGGVTEMACQIILSGPETVRASYPFPVARIGSFSIFDPLEIDSYLTVRDLMVKYINDPRPERPLCLAVFGAPGAGKSFGVKQIARALKDGDFHIVLDPRLEFNVAQFTTLRDLATCFHLLRDQALRGDTPVVFLDEFDAPFEGRAFGWLKYFLMPMQDGKFKDGESMFNLGRAILVFVGGVNRSYEELSGRLRHRDFAEAKGPDFVSRLRGYVDILGPNAVHETNDRLWQIRRAVVLRSLFKVKMPKLFSDWRPGVNSNELGGNVNIDADVLHALLTVNEFKHGTRSMEAILDMSRLAPREHRFVKASLPPLDQLDLHVDPRDFRAKLEGLGSVRNGVPTRVPNERRARRNPTAGSGRG